MIGEIDRNTLRSLVQREGIATVLQTIAEVCIDLGMPGEHPAHIAREMIAAIKPEATEAAAQRLPRIVSADPPRKSAIVRPQPGPTRIVSAKPPPRAPRRK